MKSVIRLLISHLVQVSVLDIYGYEGDSQAGSSLQTAGMETVST
jgi:hypothetical protein